MARDFYLMSIVKRLMFSAFWAPFLAAPAGNAAEFEVLDRFSVDGYTVLRSSADIPGGFFTVGGSTFVVKSGNVGIGTAAPGQKLEVSGVSGTAISILTASDSVGDTTQLNLGANPSIPQGGVILKSIRTSVSGANTDLTISPTFGGSQAEALRVLSNGNVGIGTTDPRGKLDVSGTVFIADGNQLQIGVSGTSGLQLIGQTGTQALVGSMGSEPLILRTASVERARINASGNVGIGTTSPAALLDVSGSLLVSAASSTIKHAVRTVQNGGLTVGTYYVKLFDNSADASPKLSFKMTSAAGSEYGAEVDIFIPSYVYYQPNNYGGWTDGIGPQITTRMGGLSGQSATFKNIHAVSTGAGDLQIWLEFYTDYTTRVISVSENPGSGAITWAGLTMSAPANIHKSVAFVTGAKNENGIASRFDGNVGIGTTGPKTALDVNGLVRVGRYTAAGMPACNSDTLGSFAFDTTNDRPYTCASTGWKPLDSDYDKDGIVDWNDWDDIDANKKNVNLIAANIKKGVEIFGVTGTFTGIPVSCKAVLDSGYSTGDGTYLIDPNGGDAGDAFAVYCDMTADGGGWTVLIRHPVSATTQNPLSDYGTVSVSGNYSIWSKEAGITYNQMLYKPSYNANLWASATKGVNGWSAPVAVKYTDTNGTVYNYTSSERVFLSGGSPGYSSGCAGYTPSGAYGLVLMEFPPGAWCSHTGYGFGLSGGDMRGCHVDSWKWNWGGSPGDANQCPDPAQFKSGSTMVGIR